MTKMISIPAVGGVELAIERVGEREVLMALSLDGVTFSIIKAQRSRFTITDYHGHFALYVEGSESGYFSILIANHNRQAVLDFVR